MAVRHVQVNRAVEGSSACGRHPSDAIRLGAAAVLLAVCLLAVRRDSLTTFEIDVFRLVNDLPEWLRPPLVLVMQMGNVFTAFVVAGVFLLWRKVRPALDVGLAGGMAWVVAKLIKDWIGRPRPGGLLDEVGRLAEDAGRGFVSGHAAVAFAIATAVAPHLPRRWRRAAFVAAFVVGAARIYEGVHLPLDIVGGAALGWGLAALLHVVAGAPHRRPTTAEAARVLQKAGFGECQVTPLGGKRHGSFPFFALAENGPLFIKLIDPEARDHDLLYRATRFLLLRDLRDAVSLRDPLARAEHEATMALLARQADVRVPTVLSVQQSGRQVWLTEEWAGGTNLEEADLHHLSDDVLVDLWQELRRLHGAGIAHRDLDLTNIVIDEAGRPWIVDFAHSAICPAAHAFDNDVAQLLVTTALATDADRAVAAGRHVLGPDRLSVAATELQLLAQPRVIRDALGERPEVLRQLRRLLLAADDDAGVRSEPASARLIARPSAVAALVLSLAAVFAVGGGDDVVRAATTGSWRWAIVAMIGGFIAATACGASLVLMTERPVALGRTTAALVAAESTAIIDGRRAADRTVAGFLVANGFSDKAAINHVERSGRARLILAVVALPVVGVVAALDGTTATLGWQGVALMGAAVVIAAFTKEAKPPKRSGWLVTTPAAGVALIAETAITALLLMAAVEVVGGAVGGAGVAAAAIAGIVVVEGTGAHPNMRPLLWAAVLTVFGEPVAYAAAAAVGATAALHWVPALLGLAFAHRLRRYVVG